MLLKRLYLRVVVLVSCCSSYGSKEGKDEAEQGEENQVVHT